MTSVTVLTDSCASIPESLIEQLHIRTVAYYIHRGKEIFRDLVTVQRDEFLRWMMTARSLPTTASPGPNDYFEAFKNMANEGKDEIISLHMTSKGSGAYQASTIAQTMMKDEFPNIHIEVVDTQNVSLCQGWMAINAARAALAGLSLDQITATVKKNDPRHTHDPNRRHTQIPLPRRTDRQSTTPCG